jgi:glycosyltransferase involved in cell wall biosynthesis
MKNNNPTISVIIPTYNRARLLPRAIESVLKQTFTDFELIIVDDGSTDNTKEVINSYIKKDNRITYVYQENSGGPAKPKNTGIKIAKGEYIAFLDSDDEWLPSKLEKQYKLYEDNNNKNNNIGLVGCGSINIRNKKEIYIPIKSLNANSKKLLIRCVPHSSSSIIIKRSIFKKVGLFDENIKIGEDRELYIRINKKYKFLFIQEPLFNYYIHDNNISISDNKKGTARRVKNRLYIMKKHKNIYKKYPNLYYNELKKIGTFYMLNKEYISARKNFIKAMRIKPFSRIYINLILSYNPWLYKKVLSAKKSIFEKKYYDKQRP